VVPRRETMSAIDGHDRTLVAGDQHDLRMVRVDPQPVIVVTAGRAFEGVPGHPAIHGFPYHHIRRIYNVLVLRIGFHFRKVVPSSPKTLIAVELLPALACIVAAVDTAVCRIGSNGRIQPRRIARRDAKPDPGKPLADIGQTLCKLVPGRAAIGRLIQPAVGPVPRTVLPGTLAAGPEIGVYDLRIDRIDRDLDRPGVLIFVEHFVPVFAAIRASEYAAFRIRSVRMTEHGDKDAVRIFRIHRQPAHLLSLRQPDVHPCLAGVGGPVYAVSYGKVRPLDPFAACHIDNIRIGRRYFHVADRAGGLRVKNGIPGPAEISRFPNAAIIYADVEDVKFLRHPAAAYGASAPVRPDHAPAEIVE